MADFTPNYNLKKPLRTEYYNVADANGNSDIVDTQLKAVNDRVDLVEGDVDALELGKVDKVVGKQLSDENYTLPEKNKVANLPDDTNAQLADKLQNFKIKNEAVNGDFSQGTTGYTGSQATVAVVNGEGEITCTVAGGASYGLNVNTNLLAINKYFMSYKIKTFRTHTPLIWVGAAINAGKTVTLGVMTKVSALFQPPSNRSSVILYGNAASATDLVIGSKVNFDDITVIDLTTIFGSGSEPTKLEMDELMKVIPNQWWDGELTLTQKQFITWQLNLIRKNTNAIIALGGTII